MIVKLYHSYQDFSTGMLLIQFQSRVLDEMDHLMSHLRDFNKNWNVAPIHGSEYNDSKIMSLVSGFQHWNALDPIPEPIFD